MRLEGELKMSRCPHCGIAHPTLALLWHSQQPVLGATQGPGSVWAVYRCASCGSCVLAQGMPGHAARNADIEQLFPGIREAHPDLPDMARRFLDQAYQTLHA